MRKASSSSHHNEPPPLALYAKQEKPRVSYVHTLQETIPFPKQQYHTPLRTCPVNPSGLPWGGFRGPTNIALLVHLTWRRAWQPFGEQHRLPLGSPACPSCCCKAPPDLPTPPWRPGTSCTRAPHGYPKDRSRAFDGTEPTRPVEHPIGMCTSGNGGEAPKESLASTNQ